MTTLQGKPGHYTVRGMGYVITGSGLVTAPDEAVPYLVELGFTPVEGAEATNMMGPFPTADDPVSMMDGEAVGEQPKARKSKGSVMTTGDFGSIAK